MSLNGNALEGPVPLELGGLRRLEFLHLDGNALTGALPRSLLRIGGLVRFRFERNAGLCAPGTAEFVAWLDGIGEFGRGPFCNEKDRAALAALHAAAGGEGWTDSGGWLGGVALAGWHGVRTDSLGRVATLDLAGNGLAGRLPAGLGDLAAMTALRVGDNALSGRLPRTLLDLPLGELDYAGTELCAPADEVFRAWLDAIAVLRGTGAECAPATDREILEMLHAATGGRDWIDSRNWLTDAPLAEWRGVEVDDQGRVVELRLWDNGLAGRLPPELGDLAHLEYLRLSDNALTGAIPPEFAGLSSLAHLVLDGNGLSGPIPPELGGLPALEELRVENNDLSGSLPSELGGLASLRGLGLTGNPGLAGPLPAELTSLARLERLLTGGTGLCAPADPIFAAWLDGVHTRRVAPCADGRRRRRTWCRRCSRARFRSRWSRASGRCCACSRQRRGPRMPAFRRFGRGSSSMAGRRTWRTFRASPKRSRPGSTRARSPRRSAPRFRGMWCGPASRWSSRSTRTGHWIPRWASRGGFPRPGGLRSTCGPCRRSN